MNSFRRGVVLGFLILILSSPVFASSPTAAISASPVQGVAPLSVFFDASGSSSDTVDYLWNFGDGAASTAIKVSHIYNVAGTYLATLTVTNASGAESTSQLTIVVGGSGEGPLTGDMNFRMAINASTVKMDFAQANRDSLTFQASFNTVDLPVTLTGLAASFSINGVTTNGNGGAFFSGVLNQDGLFASPNGSKPNYQFQIDSRDQLLIVFVNKGSFAQALASSGIVQGASGLHPITFSFTVGAQTYAITENFLFTSSGSANQGQFNSSKKIGTVQDGFLVVTRASAQESLNGTSHFFEFDGVLSRPAGALLQTPPNGGTWVFGFNDATPLVVPFDRIRLNGVNLRIHNSERDLGGIRDLTINTITRRFVIQTWDIVSDVTKGGTGLPLRGNPFLGFNFALRLDLDQPDGTTLHAVTGTRLQRKTRDDAFWQTGRRKGTGNGKF